MAQMNSYKHEEASLRAINYRIASTPTKQLPYVVPQVASLLWSCKNALSGSQSSQKSHNDLDGSVHRFKTSVASLLQDRSIEGRWSAVVLTKAAVEAGGVETLGKSGRWIKGLLTVLKRPDPPTTRNLAILTLTRIFMLTWDDSNLVRELTTPNLPTFISSCLQIVENERRRGSSELRTVLQAFSVLLPKHPTIFRTYESRIRAIVLRILSAGAPANEPFTHHTEKDTIAAREVLALLSQCTPKQASGEKWVNTIQSIVSAAHQTCDQLFRSVNERESMVPTAKHTSNPNASYTSEMVMPSQDSLGLAPWQGIYAARERLLHLLLIIGTHLEKSMPSTTTIPMGHILALVTRVLCVNTPSSETRDELRVNLQVSRDERETMYSLLPIVHTTTLRFLHTLVTCLDATILPVVQTMLDLALTTFASESSHDGIRSATYSLIGSMLVLIGASMAKPDVADLSLVISACCNDLLRSSTHPQSTTTNPADASHVKQTISNGAAPSFSDMTQSLLEVKEAAAWLLSVLLSKINPSYLPQKVRSHMERTAVLISHHEALVACVLNPARKADDVCGQPSLLPFLARMHSGSLELEALLRPRIPVQSLRVSSVKPDEDVWHDDYDQETFQAFEHDESVVIQNGMDITRPNGEPDDAPVLNNPVSKSSAVQADFYATTPPAGVADSFREPRDTGTVSPARKRLGSPSTLDSISAKRVRPSMVAEALQSEQTEPPSESEVASTDLPHSDATTSNSSAAQLEVSEPLTKADASPVYQSTIVDNCPPAQSNIPTTYSTTGSGYLRNGDDDDSDLEIPPINVDPDTESEEESGDNDEQAGSSLEK